MPQGTYLSSRNSYSTTTPPRTTSSSPSLLPTSYTSPISSSSSNFSFSPSRFIASRRRSRRHHLDHQSSPYHHSQTHLHPHPPFPIRFLRHLFNVFLLPIIKFFFQSPKYRKQRIPALILYSILTWWIFLPILGKITGFKWSNGEGGGIKEDFKTVWEVQKFKWNNWGWERSWKLFDGGEGKWLHRLTETSSGAIDEEGGKRNFKFGLTKNPILWVRGSREVSVVWETGWPVVYEYEYGSGDQDQVEVGDGLLGGDVLSAAGFRYGLLSEVQSSSSESPSPSSTSFVRKWLVPSLISGDVSGGHVTQLRVPPNRQDGGIRTRWVHSVKLEGLEIGKKYRYEVWILEDVQERGAKERMRMRNRTEELKEKRERDDGNHGESKFSKERGRITLPADKGSRRPGGEAKGEEGKAISLDDWKDTRKEKVLFRGEFYWFGSTTTTPPNSKSYPYPTRLTFAAVADNQFAISIFVRIMRTIATRFEFFLPASNHPAWFKSPSSLSISNSNSWSTDRPDVFLHVGDAVQNYDSTREWQTDFWNPMTWPWKVFSKKRTGENKKGGIGSTTPVIYARGNHDFDIERNWILQGGGIDVDTEVERPMLPKVIEKPWRGGKENNDEKGLETGDGEKDPDAIQGGRIHPVQQQVPLQPEGSEPLDPSDANGFHTANIKEDGEQLNKSVSLSPIRLTTNQAIYPHPRLAIIVLDSNPVKPDPVFYPSSAEAIALAHRQQQQQRAQGQEGGAAAAGSQKNEFLKWKEGRWEEWVRLQKEWVERETKKRRWRDAGIRMVLVHGKGGLEEWWGNEEDWVDLNDREWSRYVRTHLFPILHATRASLIISGHSHAYARGLLPFSISQFYTLPSVKSSKDVPKDVRDHASDTPHLRHGEKKGKKDGEETPAVEVEGTIHAIIGGGGGTLDMVKVENWGFYQKTVTGKYHWVSMAWRAAEEDSWSNADVVGGKSKSTSPSSPLPRIKDVGDGAPTKYRLSGGSKGRNCEMEGLRRGVDRLWWRVQGLHGERLDEFVVEVEVCF